MKFKWLLVLYLLLSACVPDPGEDAGTEIPETESPATEQVVVETQAPIVTEKPIATEEILATEAPTEPPLTEAPVGCIELLHPLDKAELPAVGKVTFEWTALEGAETYLLNFTLPNDTFVTIETDGTTRDRYMESFGMAGEFEWNVTGLNALCEELCSSDFFTFAKPQTPENAPQSDGGGDGGNDEKPPTGPGN